MAKNPVVTFQVWDKPESEGGKIVEVAARRIIQRSGWCQVLYKTGVYMLHLSPNRIYLSDQTRKRT